MSKEKLPPIDEALEEPKKPKTSRFVNKKIHIMLMVVVGGFITICLVFQTIKDASKEAAKKKAKANVEVQAKADDGVKPDMGELNKALVTDGQDPGAATVVPDALRMNNKSVFIPQSDSSAPDAQSASASAPISSGQNGNKSDSNSNLPPVPAGKPGSGTATKFGPGAYNTPDVQAHNNSVKEMQQAESRDQALASEIIAQRGGADDKVNVASLLTSSLSPASTKAATSTQTNSNANQIAQSANEFSNLESSIKERLAASQQKTDAQVSAAQAAIQKALGTGTGAPEGTANLSAAGGAKGTTDDQAWLNTTVNAAANQKSTASLKSDGTVNWNVLIQGSVVPVVTITAINSDLPGEIKAVTTSNVYSSRDGRYLILPKGSVFYGAYNSNINVGQERIMAAFTRIVRPDGVSINIGGMGAYDSIGQSGLTGDVNNHFWKMFASSFAIAAITKAVENDATTTTNLSTGQVAGSAAGSVLEQTAETILARNKSIKPTITVKQGMRFNIMVKQDIDLNPYVKPRK